jgi:probable rRNA maturation factor
MMQIEVANRQSHLSVDTERLLCAVRAVVEEAGFTLGEISIAVVDNTVIHELNRKYLRHDDATDVLSFVFEREATDLAGEVIVSAEMAITRGQELGWAPEDELLLYVIHGVLHLVGLDDQAADDRARMRAAERRYLALFGLQPPNDETSTTAR